MCLSQAHCVGEFSLLCTSADENDIYEVLDEASARGGSVPDSRWKFDDEGIGMDEWGSEVPQKVSEVSRQRTNQTQGTTNKLGRPCFIAVRYFLAAER